MRILTKPIIKSKVFHFLQIKYYIFKRIHYLKLEIALLKHKFYIFSD